MITSNVSQIPFLLIFALRFCIPFASLLGFEWVIIPLGDPILHESDLMCSSEIIFSHGNGAELWIVFAAVAELYCYILVNIHINNNFKNYYQIAPSSNIHKYSHTHIHSFTAKEWVVQATMIWALQNANVAGALLVKLY